VVVDAQAIQIGIVNAKICPLDRFASSGTLRFFELGCFLNHIDAKKRTHENHADNNAGDPERLSDGIRKRGKPRGRFICVDGKQGLLGRAERRCVGCRPGKKPCGGTKTNSENFCEDQRQDSTANHDGGGESI